MSYKPVLVKYCAIKNKNILEGKETILLGKCYDDYYEVSEYIGLIKEIGPKYKGDDGMVEAKILFRNQEIYKVRVYVDDNIHLNTFVSIYGSFCKSSNSEQLELICKGGMVRAFEALGQAGRVNTNKLYRFGIAQLSEAKESKKFPKNIPGIEVLEENRLWILSTNNLKELEQNREKLLEDDKNTVDLSAPSSSVFMTGGINMDNIAEIN